MKRGISISCIVLALALAAPGGALAGGKDRSKMLAALENAATSPAQAIDVAVAETGGQAVDMKAKDRDGVLLYKVTSASQGKPVEVFVSADTGKIVKTEQQGFFSGLFDEEDDVQTVSPVSLKTAVETAERESGGKAFEAERDAEDNVIRYKVKVASAQGVHDVVIDATTGAVLGNETKDHEGGEK